MENISGSWTSVLPLIPIGYYYRISNWTKVLEYLFEWISGQSGTLSDQHYIRQSKEIIVFEMVTANRSEIEYKPITTRNFSNIFGVTKVHIVVFNV
jgi:hypothetical protein